MIDWKNNFGSPSRETTMREAMRLFREREGRLIVETGCYRGIDGDGYSTLHWAALAKEVNGWFWSVELNPNHAFIALKALQEFGLRGDVVVGDSVTWLSTYRQLPIDFLYLDSADFESSDPISSQLHQLAEAGAAWGKLDPHAIILLDDAGLKTNLSEDWLQRRGFKVVMKDYQVLLTR